MGSSFLLLVSEGPGRASAPLLLSNQLTPMG